MSSFHHLLRGVAVLAVTALVAVPVTSAIVDSAETDTPYGSVTAALAQAITVPAASRPQRCHGPGALIRTHHRIRQVSVSRGLRTYEHQAPGTFLGLCSVGGDATPQGS